MFTTRSVTCLALFSLCFSLSTLADQGAISAIEKKLLPKVILDGKPQSYQTLESMMQQLNVPGMSIAVARDGKLLWAKGYGIANKKTNRRVDSNTLFQAGSISKPVAALAALHLVDQGKAKLDADVNDYLTSWKVPTNELTKQQPVTLRHLLTHTGGTSVHGFPGYMSFVPMPTNVEVLDGNGNTAPVEVNQLPGQTWRYSGGGYTIMEQLVEDIAKQSLASYSQQHVLKPLGMSQSTFEQPLPKEQHEIASAAFDAQGQQIAGDWHNYPEQAAAGLWTTPTDLINYAISLQQNYANASNKVLSQKMVQAMFTPHKSNWGLGPAMQRFDSGLTFGHGGKSEGFTNNMIASVEPGTAFVVMANGDNANEIITAIMLTLSDYYALDWFKQQTIKPTTMTAEFRAKLAGTYVFAQDPNYLATIDPSDEIIKVTDSEGSSFQFLPTSEQMITNIKSGAIITFSISKDGNIEGFSWGTGGYYFSKQK